MSECHKDVNVNDSENGKGTERVPELSTVNGSYNHEKSGRHVEDNINDDDDDDDNKRLNLCCLSGCLTILSVSILMFLALPAGILLCAYASSNNDSEVLVVGIVLASSPVISFPLIALILYNRRRLSRLRNRKLSTTNTLSKDGDSLNKRY
ncbi:hypothetical protein ACF0H5_009872 [Mactra antiquata]